MSAVIVSLIAACNSKACAPPPVGTGGSVGRSASGMPAFGDAEHVERFVGIPAKQSSAWRAAANRAFGAMMMHNPEDEKQNKVSLRVGEALNYYTEIGYREINQFLRGGGRVPARLAPASASSMRAHGLGQIVRHLDEAFRAASVATPADAVLYRGTHMTPELSRMLQPGAVFKDHGFVSTSTDVVKAHEFAVLGRDTGPASVLRITAPKGTRAMMGDYVEHELILNRGTSFRVHSRKWNAQQQVWDVDVEVVQ